MGGSGPHGWFATSIDAVEASEPRPRSSRRDRWRECPSLRSRPQQYHVASPPSRHARSGGKARGQWRPCSPSLCLNAWCWPKRTRRPPRVTGEEVRASQLEIVFDINSSFLGPRAIAALRDLAGELPAGRQYRLALAAAVSDDGVKGAKTGGPNVTIAGSPSVAWIVSRHWLREHGEAELDVEPGFIDHDSSRRVTIAARPLP